MFMNIALVADLHGNWPAVRAVDADITARGIKDIYCLGDMIGKGPSSVHTMHWALERCKLIIAGNWDILVAQGAYDFMLYHMRQIGDDNIRIIRALPLEHSLWMSGRRIRLFHGRPVMQNLLLHGEADDPFIPYFKSGDDRYDVLGYADTHMEEHRRLFVGGGSYTVFNTGSVGNALGGDNFAHYVILSGELGDDIGKTAPFTITFVSVDYNREEAIRDAICAKDMPGRDEYIREIETGLYSR